MNRPPRKNRTGWRRWAYWAFIGLNLAGLVLLIPLAQATWPLLQVWWHTRSLENLRQWQGTTVKALSLTPTNSSEPTAPQPETSTAALLDSLTNRLDAVEHLSAAEIQKIVARQFGAKPVSPADAKKFDSKSAVFNQIHRLVLNNDGELLYGYAIDLVDQNGNHKYQLDCFRKPDLDYERSMATLQAVHSNPQLKKIYDAFAYVLAERSSNTNSAPTTAPAPAFRLER